MFDCHRKTFSCSRLHKSTIKKGKWKKILLIPVFGLPWILFTHRWTSITPNPPKLKYPNFYFVETSGSTTLNPRQACAVESAARQHHLSNITVIMSSETISEQTINLFRTLPNTYIFGKTLDQIFANSALEGWYKKGEWKRSIAVWSHLSDAVRMLLIWTYGGIYLDLDVVTLKPLYDMGNNFLVSEGYGSIAAGILAFEPRHPLISACLRYIPKHYKPSDFRCIGPYMVTKLVKSLCQTNLESSVAGSNCSITVYPPVTAFPVAYFKWRDYFDRKKATEVLRAANSSHMVHIWNFLSNKLLLSLNSGSAYEKIMQQHCPNVYSFVSLNNIRF